MAKTVVRFPASHAGATPLTVGVSKLPRLLSVSPRNLRSIMTEDPSFPPRFTIGKRDFVLVEELESWIAGRIAAGPRRRTG